MHAASDYVGRIRRSDVSASLISAVRFCFPLEKVYTHTQTGLVLQLNERGVRGLSRGFNNLLTIRKDEYFICERTRRLKKIIREGERVEVRIIL